MKNIICPLCGELIVVDLDLDEGQNVRCPFCREKFPYDSSLLQREINKELIETAIARCCEDPLQADFYHNAPDGAKLYIGLLFLGQIYGKGIARAEYMKLYSGVEPTLRKSDLLYLIKHEKDPQIICYLNQIAIKNEYGDLLAKKNDFVAVVRTQHAETALPKERALTEAFGCEPELTRSKEKPKGSKGNKCQSQRVPPSSGSMNAEALSRYRKDMASTELREVVSKLIRFLMLLIAVSAVVGVWWFLKRELPEGAILIGKPAEKVPAAIPETAPSAPKPQSEFESFLRIQAPIVKARFDSVSKMLEVVRDDWRKFEQEISTINAEAKVVASEALVQKRMRLNSAEWAMTVFTSPVIAGLYERYQGESITNQAQQCERQIRSGLSAADGPTQEVFEGLDQYAFALMTRMIDKVRHAMEEREILLRGYKTEIAKLSNDLRAELLGAVFTESARVAEKRLMLEERLSSKPMTDDIQLKDLSPTPNPAKPRGDYFVLTAKNEVKASSAQSVAQIPTEDNTMSTDPSSDRVEPAPEPPEDPIKITQDKWVPSDMTPAQFIAEKGAKVSIFRATSRMSSEFPCGDAELRECYVAYELLLQRVQQTQDGPGSGPSISIICIAKKDSETCRRMNGYLHDGKWHYCLVALQHRDIEGLGKLCELCDFVPCTRNWRIQDETESESPVRAKFTTTRLAITKGDTTDFLQGRIAVEIRTALKYFVKPLLRVVVLTEENGSRVVRDVVLHDPNLKVVDDDITDGWWSDWVVHTTTVPEGFGFGYWGHGDVGQKGMNERHHRCRTIEDISTAQAEVAKEAFSRLQYLGVPLGQQTRRGVSGQYQQTMFGFGCFDKDSKIKVVGWRLEMWHAGKCIESWDSISKSSLKRMQLPEDWHVSFKYPKRFKYLPPWSRQRTVRR